jgi:hypothetical protein
MRSPDSIMRTPFLPSAARASRPPPSPGGPETAYPAALRYGSLFEAARRSVPGVSSLQHELVELQRRLGTAREQPDDLRRVREAAHKLNNLLCVAMLRDQLARLERIDYGGAAAA